jgi:glycosyltransferase involved in cell wall biosynthesis
LILSLLKLNFEFIFEKEFNKSKRDKMINPPKKKNTPGKNRSYRTYRNYRSRKKFSFRKLSIVVPLYNEEESLKPLFEEIRKGVRNINMEYEILFVDDGSTDGSLNIIKELSKRDTRVKYISFRKNYGKSAALNVGFKNATGDVVITMDADLQDDPLEIPNLLKKLEEGYDLVSGWKKVRYDPFIKRNSSKFFNWVTRIFSGIKIHDFNCGLKAYRSEVTKSVYVHGELHRYIPVLAGWQGFRITEIPVKHHPRRYGKTKFGISRFFKGFVDLITVIFTTRYIRRPLHLFGFVGAVSFTIGFIIDAVLAYLWKFHNMPLSNRPLLLLGLLLMIVGVQLFAIGLLGEMMVYKFRSDDEFGIKEKN